MSSNLTPIPWLHGYSADLSTGEIWSTRRAGAPNQLAGGVSTKGYRIYSLMVGGKQKTVSGHVTIARLAYGPAEPGLQCCHANGNKTDNRAENLRWATASENNGRDKEATGMLRFGEHHPNSKLTAAAVSEIRAARSRGATLSRLSAAYGVSEATVSRIARNEAWVRS